MVADQKLHTHCGSNGSRGAQTEHNAKHANGFLTRE